MPRFSATRGNISLMRLTPGSDPLILEPDVISREEEQMGELGLFWRSELFDPDSSRSDWCSCFKRLFCTTNNPGAKAIKPFTAVSYELS
jgi:hypothetical protein